MIHTKNPREAAYLALLASLKDERFIADSLEDWFLQSKPSIKDYHFARQIAFGASQMALALDYLAAQLSDKKKLSLKPKEKALLRIALYQHYYLDKVPLYANTNEIIAIAKKYCHSTFVGFLNASLRKLGENAPTLPKGDTLQELSIFYSYPSYFIQELLADFGENKAVNIMSAGNVPAITMARVRNEHSDTDIKDLEVLEHGRIKMNLVKNGTLIPKIAALSSYYIQNITPAVLIDTLSDTVVNPKNILDLCCAPGGKLVLVHDLFPKAHLVANDVSEEKLLKITQNCDKYGIKAGLSCSKGEEFTSNTLFDLVILDVPCSNSGVLNKRSEARWRLSKESLAELEKIQLQLLENAVKLLSVEGVIWYMTCSILSQENEKLIKRAAKKLGLTIVKQEIILPNAEGWDGGFACALKKA